MSTIAVLGTYDSKGHELDFVARCIATRGHTPLRIDVGTLDEPVVAPDVRRDAILDFSTVSDRNDRGACVAAMAADRTQSTDGGMEALVGKVLDGEVKRIIDEAYVEAIRLLQSDRPRLDALAKALLERESLDEREILEVTGLPPKPGRAEAGVLSQAPASPALS